MKLEDHEAKALSTFGRKYTFIHEFLDQYFSMFGPYHRIILHHRKGIGRIIETFSDEDSKEIERVAKQHIKDDLNCVPGDYREFYFESKIANAWLSEEYRKAGVTLHTVLLNVYPFDTHIIEKLR